MNTGIDSKLSNKISEVFRKYPQINSAILYGSRATGNFKKGSDIDITLMGKDLNLNILTKIYDDFDDLLTPYKFDISIYKDIKNKDLIEHIKEFGIEIYPILEENI